MLEHAGVPKDDVPKWVGFSTTVTATCAGVMGMVWGMASDSIGRKRVILLELNLMLVFILLFGFSQHLALLVLFRALLGLVSGSIGIMRTMIAEMVPEKLLQPYAFSILPTVETIGSGFGPALGGLLAHPAEHYSGIFGNVALLKMFPFALSSIASSCIVAVAITMASASLHETKPGLKDSPDSELLITKVLRKVWALRNRQAPVQPVGVDETTALLGDTIEEVDEELQHIEEALERRAADLKRRWLSIVSPQPILLLLISGAMSMHTVAFDSLFPVLLDYPVQHLKGNPDVHLPFKFSSGLGLDTSEMGLFYSIVGVSSMIVQLVIFPWAARKYGILQCLRLASTVFPMLYLVVPFVPLLPQPLASVAVCALLIFKMAGSAFVFPCCTILISEVAGTIGMLATVNGIGTSINAFGQGLGPGVLGPVFSFGVKRGYMILPWWLLAGFAFLSSIPVAWVTEMDISPPEVIFPPNEEEQQAGDTENGEARGRQLGRPELVSFPV
ncbi:major facilitator superfamily domain-containing protein [Aspergillus pseudonomiae]|uniref:Major facilitator superfamily domain-containing protein n=1 Tax=Aspergillus pseudonomiae TaxID=1506151 RepID=A0A5N7DRJ2_9EURO|nr:major facilitator superfamily domain-containing protein [Aspergillus pseudonomiae]KAE8408639.1 major facilitator superfamily domain-containing protein [Aspergillus pseudonomiae]